MVCVCLSSSFWDPLCFPYLDICFLLQVWDAFSHNLLKYIFNPLLSLFSFWDLYNVNIGMFKIILETSSIAFIFKYVFQLSFLIGWFPFYLPDHIHIFLYHIVFYSILLVFFFFLFFLAIVFFISDWGFLYFRVPWWVVHCLHQFFSLIQLRILLPTFLIFYLVNYLFHYLFFQGFSLDLSIESSSSAISFCLTFSASMNLCETVTYCILVRVFLPRSIAMKIVCAQCLWWESWFWHGWKLHFSSGYAGGYHLGMAWGWNGGTWDRVEC